MDPIPASGAAPSTRYRLTPTVMPEGRISIVLHLHRDTGVYRKLLAVVDPKDAADVLFKCHQHLRRLGVDGLPDPADLPAALGAGTRRPPSATEPFSMQASLQSP